MIERKRGKEGKNESYITIYWLQNSKLRSNFDPNNKIS